MTRRKKERNNFCQDIARGRGTNRPSGAASRILSMMEMDSDFIEHFPFVKIGEKKE